MAFIRIKLKDWAQKMGKTVSQIAEETNLNRNTITALFHNKVDGIRFDTLEKLNKTYGLAMTDLLEQKISTRKETEILPKYYVQETPMVIFNAWPAFMALNTMPDDVFGSTFGQGYMFFHDRYAVGFWDRPSMDRIARFVYDRYHDPRSLNKLYSTFEGHARTLEQFYFSCDQQAIMRMDGDELENYFQQVWDPFHKMWRYSLFIDAFDPGFDYDTIKQIAQRHQFDPEEVAILSTPSQRTFNNERLLSVMQLAKTIRRRRIPKNEQDEYVLHFAKHDPAAVQYTQQFDYYQSNYAHIDHITAEELAGELSRFLDNPEHLRSEYLKLSTFSTAHEKKVRRILKQHNLEINPLEFFARLAWWREYRKKLNLMGLHVFDTILSSLESKTGIAKKYLQFLSFEEVRNAAKGLIAESVLTSRANQPMMISIKEDRTYSLIIGAEAKSLKQQLDEEMSTSETVQTIIPGQSASRGYAKGLARIVLDQRDFDKFKEGEILVTGMTRPEFLPVMKKAAGIVTNEGGITSHAAIVSRELGKPCVIATKHATKLIKNGDLVEVRANHGTVRILQ